MLFVHQYLSRTETFFYRFTHILFGKTTGFCQKVSLLPNCIRFSSFSHIPTAFSVKEIHLSAKIHNILFLFTFSLYTIAETPDFCQIVSIAMLSAVSKITLGCRLVAAIFAGCECKHSRPAHYPRKKRGSPTTVMNPTQFDIRQTRFDKIPLLLCGNHAFQCGAIILEQP